MSFKNIPFVRILIPFLAGILLSSIARLNLNLFYFLVASLFLTGIFYLLIRKEAAIQNKRWFIVSADLFLFLAGMYSCYLYDVRNSSAYYGNNVSEKEQSWVGEVKDLPVEKEKFHKVLMEVKTFGEKKQVSGKVVVYLRKPFDVSLLKPGNILRVISQFNSPKAPLNPHEFDYKTFLARKNIYYQSFAEAENVSLVTDATGFSLVDFGLGIKQKIKSAFESGRLNPEAAQLCTALLTGYDDEISPETINAFAHSGTLHVLSVSGLHTGILYAVLVFLLGLIDKHKKHKWLHLVIITLGMWFFVLITGFSPPVLRAAIMLNLIAVGRFYYSYTNLHAVNILAVSAFLILIFNPLLIFDTGFLLSYSAVLGILYFEPLITPLINSRFGIVNKVWQLTSVSLAAQITTLPITLYLFHQFPLWFVFSNLLVIPLCTVIMFLGLIFLLKMSFISSIINLCSSLVFYCIHLTDVPDIGYLDHIDFGWKDLAFLSVLILFVSVFIKKRNFTLGAGILSVIILWQLFSLFEVVDKKSGRHLSIYHISKQSVVDIKNKMDLILSSNLTESNYNYHVKNNHTFYNYPCKNELNFDYVKSEYISVFRMRNENQNALIGFLKPQYLIVTNNSEPDLSLLGKNLKLLIADGSNSYSNIKKLRQLCDKFAVPFHSTAEKGYLELNL